MRRLAGLALALVAGCATGGRDVGEPLVIALSPYVGRLVTVEADAGSGPAPVLFDTGAGVTALTPESASRAVCTPFGRLVGWRMSGERVEFQRCGVRTLRIDDYETAHEVYVFDLAAVLPKELPPLDGILSIASFANRPFTLDLADRILTLETPQSLRERTASATPVAMRLLRGPGGDDLTVLVRVEAETGDLWFLLDSGNLDVIAVSAHALKQMGVSLDDEAARSGKEPFALSFVLDGIGPVEAPARASDIIYDGALSEDVMRRYAITFDLANARLWFAPK